MKMANCLRRKCRRQRGQTLVYVVMLMLILLVISIFLFDLQSFIRLRGKSQNAVDAAVLSAAGWQGRSLNIIGELNLVKATTLMISEIEPIDDASEEGLLAADALITQMQTRVTYIGPLLGYIAAQQAAKNNGLREVPEFTESLRRHIGMNFGDTLNGNSLFEEIYADNIPYNGYNWHDSYELMLLMLTVEKLAVKTVNTRYLAGMPQLVGPGADLLMDPSFYAAVQARSYCWFIRRGIPEDEVFDFSGVELVADQKAFFPGSEFLNLYVRFQVQVPPFGTVQPFLDGRGLNRLPDDQPGLANLTWAVFDNSDMGWSNTSSYDFINRYLRSPFKDEYTYGGAAARMFCEAQPSLLTGRWAWKYGQTDEEKTDLGKELQWSEAEFGDSGASFSSYGQRLSQAEQSMAELRRSEVVYSSAAAKPFGKLTDSDPPQAAGVILPVFEQVRLIPAALIQENLFDRNYRFYKFIIEYFGNEDYPNVPDEISQKYAEYIGAIDEFEDQGSSFHEGWEAFEEWREEYMLGPDGEPDTEDDRPDPCLPSFSGGGGGGGGSRGGPGILH